MKNSDLRPQVALACCSPSLAFASGDDLLSLLWLELAIFILVLSSIYWGKLKPKGNVAVFVLYLIGAVIPFFVTQNWPYSDNLFKINAICVLTPLIFWLVSYWICLKKLG